MKLCVSCQEEKSLTDFSKKAEGSLDNYCKICRYRQNYLDDYAKHADVRRERAREWQKKNAGKVNANTAKRRAFKLKATPKWADQKKMAEFYEEAAFATEFFEVPFDVDHIVPLISELVCGLHCEANLKVIKGSLNRSKGNSYWPDMP